MPIAKKEGSFLDGLLSSGLITEEQLVEKFGDALPDDPNQLSAELVKANLLTSYQAKQLLAGKYRGFIIGPYKILRPIGRGGMGTVFLAAHTTLHRKVALKILSPQNAKDRLSLERFQREARTAASLDHPNIVKLFDISRRAGVHFLVMEYVEGRDLQSFLAETGPMHFAQAAQYIAQAAAGLQHAHEKGLIHRDIKPANLMLGKDGVVKILDMGLTRSFTDEKDDLTGMLAEGQVAGTVDYLSPEQAMNQPLDERSDLYSLGASFYALITGEPPFKGSTAQKLLQHQMKEPPSVAAKTKGGVPEALSDVIRKMMAKLPGERYATATDVIDALSPWLPANTTGNIVQNPLTASQINQPSTWSTSTRVEVRQVVEAKPVWKRPPVLIGGGIGLGILLIGLVLSAFTGGGKQQSSVVKNPGIGSPINPPREDAGEPKQIPVPPPAPKPKPKAKNPPAVGPFQPLTLADAATVHNTDRVFWGFETEKFVFDQPGVNTISDVPFLLPDAKASGNNIIILARKGGDAVERRLLPRSVRLNVGFATEQLHFLGGISGQGWRVSEGYMTAPQGSVCVVARLHYKDGSTEDHPWKNGEHFADFIMWKTENGFEPVDVPGSKFAVEAKDHVQIRYLTIRPAKPEKALDFVEFIKGEEDEMTWPVIVAVTAERTISRYQAVSISEVASVCSTLFAVSSRTKDTFVLDSWGEKIVEDVPFELTAPDGGAKNILAFHSPNATLATLPKSARLSVNAPANCLHFLSGVSMWGYPWNGTEEGTLGSPKGSVVLTVRLTYADGKTEDHLWKNGEEFVDFRNKDKDKEVPGSKEAFRDKGDGVQVRYLTIRPARPDVIEHVDFIKGETDNTAPLIFAMTVERPESAIPKDPK